MTALYLDSSAVLRYLFRQHGYLDLRQADVAIASPLTESECLRRLDRARLLQEIPPEALARRRAYLAMLLARVRMVELTPGLLRRVGDPLSAPLGTLDAIHLISALQWRELHGGPLHFATHDVALAGAARLHGLEVVGCPLPA